MAEPFRLDLEEVNSAINMIQAIGETIDADLKTMNEITALVYTPRNMASKTVQGLKKYYEENFIVQAQRSQKEISDAVDNLRKYLAQVKENLGLE